MEREERQAMQDALGAVQRAEKLLEKLDRPGIARVLTLLAPVLRNVEKFAAEHVAVSLDLRMARLRLKAMLGPEPGDEPSPSDRDTPVEPIVRRSSTQIGAVRKPPGEDR